MTQTRHANRKGKRNKAKVVDDRWEKKKEVGRVVKDEDRSYVKPPVTAKNTKQAEFLSALKTHQVIVFTAPAGVGKSFLTMCEVTDWLKKGLYDKIILSRPSVGMGNTIGLLKGGLVEKYTPFLLPMIDVIKERYGTGFYENCLNNGTIEMCPLEYIRGRNISQVAIVDEFQNCNPEEAYTMITRVAESGKLILIGDPTQNDIRGKNAMQWLPEFIKANPELAQHIAIIEATSDDIVRGGMCKMMVKAKERGSF
jgi:phosphate starvation-inducible protein PhoH and related proteins